jgi:hypothetical protein
MEEEEYRRHPPSPRLRRGKEDRRRTEDLQHESTKPGKHEKIHLLLSCFRLFMFSWLVLCFISPVNGLESAPTGDVSYWGHEERRRYLVQLSEAGTFAASASGSHARPRWPEKLCGQSEESQAILEPTLAKGSCGTLPHPCHFGARFPPAPRHALHR